MRRNNNLSKSTWLYYSLLLILVFEYLRPGNIIPILSALKVGTIFPLVTLLFSFFLKSNPSVQNIVVNKTSLWLIFLIFLLILSILTADVTLYAFNTFLGVLGYIFIYFIIRKQVTTLNRIDGYMQMLVGLNMFIILLNPMLFLMPEDRNYYLVGNPFIGDGNDFSVSICTVFPMSYYLMKRSNRLQGKILWILCMLIFAIAVVATQSRGGTIALAIIMIYLFIIKSKQKIIGLLILIVLIITPLIIAPDRYFERMNTIVNYEKEGSAMGRIMAWGSAIRMAADNPLLGVGAGHFPVKYGMEYRPPGFGRADLPWQTAHSMYFLALGELGIPGLTFLLSLLASNFIMLSRQTNLLKKLTKGSCENYKNLLNSLYASLLGLSVGGAFLSILYYPHLYLTVGLIGSGNYIVDKIYKKKSVSRDSILEGKWC
jgi:probable O-glycosylation ligase (exosortase A-associated)